jgi:hypothetical protein
MPESEKNNPIIEEAASESDSYKSNPITETSCGVLLCLFIVFIVFGII